MSRRPGSKQLLRDYFLANIGRILSADELQKAAGGAAEFGRRIRELRDEEGWPIQTHNDDVTLKPGQYILTSAPNLSKDINFKRGVSKRIRAQVLDRNGFTCQMCGLSPGDIDPQTNRKVRLHIGHIVDKSLGGKDEIGNLRSLCSTCNQGAKNVTAQKPDTIWLLGQVRRAGIDSQMEVWKFLQKKLNFEAKS